MKLIFTCLVILLSITSCSKEEYADPAGTISFSISDNEEKQFADYVLCNGTINIYISIHMHNGVLSFSFSFVNANMTAEIITVGPVDNIGAITSKPYDGYQLSQPVLAHNGYVIKTTSQCGIYDVLEYRRFYIVDCISSNGVITKITAKLQGPF